LQELQSIHIIKEVGKYEIVTSRHQIRASKNTSDRSTMEVIKVIFGLLLALCSLAQAEKLKVINELPKDQVQVSVTLIRHACLIL
jgi:hypothetical protein